jgi:hypothetical protein
VTRPNAQDVVMGRPPISPFGCAAPRTGWFTARACRESAFEIIQERTVPMEDCTQPVGAWPPNSPERRFGPEGPRDILKLEPPNVRNRGHQGCDPHQLPPSSDEAPGTLASQTFVGTRSPRSSRVLGSDRAGCKGALPVQSGAVPNRSTADEWVRAQTPREGRSTPHSVRPRGRAVRTDQGAGHRPHRSGEPPSGRGHRRGGPPSPAPTRRTWGGAGPKQNRRPAAVR